MCVWLSPMLACECTRELYLLHLSYGLNYTTYDSSAS